LLVFVTIDLNKLAVKVGNWAAIKKTRLRHFTLKTEDSINAEETSVFFFWPHRLNLEKSGFIEFLQSIHNTLYYPYYPSVDKEGAIEDYLDREQ
jgi:hypothetical protein